MRLGVRGVCGGGQSRECVCVCGERDGGFLLLSCPPSLEFCAFFSALQEHVCRWFLGTTPRHPSLSICSFFCSSSFSPPHFRIMCTRSPDIFVLLLVVALSISDVGREELLPVLAAALPPLVSSVSFGPVVFSFSGINRKQYASVSNAWSKIPVLLASTRVL
jgi:hypothetical protein